MFVSTAPGNGSRTDRNYRIMKKILLFTFATIMALASHAQEDGRQQRRQREFNPEEFAARQTQSLHQALQLDSVQFQALFLMNYADALTMQDSMKVRRERWEKMRANGETPQRAQPTEEERNARMELEKQRREIRNGKMKQILTPEQYEKYIKLQEEQKERMQRNWRGGRGGRGGHPGGRMPRQ